jgi:hypothetical protein
VRNCSIYSLLVPTTTKAYCFSFSTAFQFQSVYLSITEQNDDNATRYAHHLDSIRCWQSRAFGGILEHFGWTLCVPGTATSPWNAVVNTRRFHPSTKRHDRQRLLGLRRAPFERPTRRPRRDSDDPPNRGS